MTGASAWQKFHGLRLVKQNLPIVFYTTMDFSSNLPDDKQVKLCANLMLRDHEETGNKFLSSNFNLADNRPMSIIILKFWLGSKAQGIKQKKTQQG